MMSQPKFYYYYVDVKMYNFASLRSPRIDASREPADTGSGRASGRASRSQPLGRAVRQRVPRSALAVSWAWMPMAPPRMEHIRQPRSGAVRVHVYNASQFLMYTRCRHLQPSELSPDGHSVDFFFVRAVNELSRLGRKVGDSEDGHGGRMRSEHTTAAREAAPPLPVVHAVSPERAELFVIPVMCSQSAQGRCGGCSRHTEHVRQLQRWLNGSHWYQRRGGADHLIVCDKYSSVGEVRRALPKVIIGRYEHLAGWSKYALARVRTRTISVGYATTAGTVCSPAPPPIAPESRRYDIMSQMGTKPRPYGPSTGFRDVYARRRDLWCDWLDIMPPSARPANLLVSSPDANSCHTNTSMTWLAGKANGDAHSLRCRAHHQDYAMSTICAGLATQRDSRAVVSFCGDTPTTIRIFNAFATESIILAPDKELPMLLAILPFRSAIPWRNIIRPVPTDRFDRAPVQTLTDVAKNESLLDREATLALMRRHRADVLWDVPGSRAYLHLIREAAFFDRT